MNTLLEAAKKVLANWEGGDLAAAVRELDQAVQNAEPVKLTAVVRGGVLEDIYVENIDADNIACNVLDYDALEVQERDEWDRSKDDYDKMIEEAKKNGKALANF